MMFPIFLAGWFGGDPYHRNSRRVRIRTINHGKIKFTPLLFPSFFLSGGGGGGVGEGGAIGDFEAGSENEGDGFDPGNPVT